jgi:hypothetical protein
MKRDPGLYDFWPYRVGILREVLTHLAAQRDVWFATGEQLLDAWRSEAAGVNTP